MRLGVSEIIDDIVSWRLTWIELFFDAFCTDAKPCLFTQAVYKDGIIARYRLLDISCLPVSIGVPAHSPARREFIDTDDNDLAKSRCVDSLGKWN